MIDWISDTIFTTSVFFSIWLYWLPLAVAALGHTISIVGGVTDDIKDKSRYNRITYGDIIGGYILSVLPWINMVTAIYQIGPIFQPVVWFLNKPVIKPTEKSSGVWKEHNK